MSTSAQEFNEGIYMIAACVQECNEGVCHPVLKILMTVYVVQECNDISGGCWCSYWIK